jgi:hypothetical protein
MVEMVTKTHLLNDLASQWVQSNTLKLQAKTDVGTNFSHGSLGYDLR